MKIQRFLQITALALFLVGCSRIKFAYNQLDWLIPYYLETYMELTEEQSLYFDKQVEEILLWHCSMQLRGYAKLFRSANSKFQTGQTTRGDLDEFSSELEQYWESLLRQVIPVLSQLLLTTNDGQITELFKNFDEKNREWQEDYESQTKTERNQDYQERIGEELERWFGPLNNDQQQKIQKWSTQFSPLGMEGLKMRKKWQEHLRKLIQSRNDVSDLTLRLEGLFLNPELFRSSAYQKRLDENRKVTIELIYQVGKLLSLSQREHLASEVMTIATDFEELACKDDGRIKPGSDKLTAITRDVLNPVIE